MRHVSLLIVLAVLFLALLLLALLVWALSVRPFVKRQGGRTVSPYNLLALVADFGTSLVYCRGRLPWSLKFFGFLLIFMASDLVLILLVIFLAG